MTSRGPGGMRASANALRTQDTDEANVKCVRDRTQFCVTQFVGCCALKEVQTAELSS